MDHPDSIPKAREVSPHRRPPGQDDLPTKALVDGGSGLNLMYIDTFEGLGLT
jgi:hypothetical protein